MRQLRAVFPPAFLLAMALVVLVPGAMAQDEEDQKPRDELLEAIAETAEEGDDLSFEARGSLKRPLQERIADLRKEKNEVGASYIYGSYYDNFVPVDDGYEVTFIKRTGGREEMVAEHQVLTLKLKEGASDNWEIAEERTVKTVNELLYRSHPGDETFHRFDKFDYEKEGMRISSGPGDLVIDYWRGKPFRLWFTSDNLKYDYLPPIELGWYQSVAKLQLEKHPDDMVFTPEHVFIQGDPDSIQNFLDENFKGVKDSELTRMNAKFQNEYRGFVKDLKEARKKYPLAGFMQVQRPEIRTWGISVKRKGDEHYASMSFDNERREEVHFRVTRLGGRRGYLPLFVYNSEETRAAGVDPYEIEQRDDVYSAAAGRQTIEYDLRALEGTVELGMADMLGGDEMMSCDFVYTLVAKRDINTLPFYVQRLRSAGGSREKTPSLNVYRMQDGDGNDLTYVRTGSTYGLIVLPETLKAGEEMQVKVKFDNKGAIYNFNNTYSRVNRGGWAPFVSFSDNIDKLDLTIKVKEKYQILGIDDKFSEEIKDGIRIARYKSDYPLTFPTIIFGDYRSDASKVLATKLDGTPIPVTVYVDKTAMMTPPRPSSREDYISIITSGMWDIRQDALQPIADQAANAINLYREVYGVDYPFAKMDLVNDPMGGMYGQAPPSIVYLGAGVFRPKAEAAQWSVNAAGTASFQNTVVAHELGHQWWGGAVVNKNQGSYWFVESLAEYSSALYSEEVARYREKSDKKKDVAAKKAYLDSVEEWRRTIMNNQNMFTSVQNSDSMMPGGDGGTRTAAIYNKGPYAFHMLRLLFGDEKFFPFLKEMAQELEGKEIVTRDIQNIAETSLCGKDDQGNPCRYDLEWFFDQWIRGVGLPEYSFNYTYRQAEDGTWIVQGKVKQRVVIGAQKKPIEGEVFRGKINITVIGKNREEYTVPLVINAEETPFAFKVPKEPFEVSLNKNLEMLAHDVLINKEFDQ